jgi:hypothetical protein
LYMESQDLYISKSIFERVAYFHMGGRSPMTPQQ